MPDSEYYDILGVSRDADLSAIKKAYRQAALKYHPDKNPGDRESEERFKRAAEAYAVLSDPEKRRIYDQFGSAGLKGQPGFGGFDQDIFADFGDILGDLFGLGGIFGGTRRRGTGRQGRDLRYDLELELEDAVAGLETQIQVPRLETCEHCRGTGAEEGGVETCPTCAGRGQVAFQQGFFTIARGCGTCGGSGRRIVTPCAECEGSGRLRAERSITLKIPAGVDDGNRLRLVGEGEAGTGGAPAGDLYVVMRVKEHPFFTRNGLDLFCEAPITFSQAALGAEVRVPTLDGEETLSVAPGTQSGTRLRVRGKGVPAVNGGARGDQYVVLTVRTPTKLQAEHRELLERLAEIEDEPVGGSGFFDRVKNIFH